MMNATIMISIQLDKVLNVETTLKDGLSAQLVKHRTNSQ